MSNKNSMEDIKKRVRSTGGSSVHASFIGGESTIIQDDKKAISQTEPPKKTVNEFVAPLLPVEIKREKKKKFEELYSRDTIWIKNEIKQKIIELSEDERGVKTRIINEALEEYFKKRGR